MTANNSAIARRSLLLLALATSSMAGSARALDVPAPAQREAAEEDGDPRVVLSLIADAAEVKRGQVVRVGVLFSLDPEWHVYWHNPGQAALATDVTMVSDGASIDDISWPAPERFTQASGFIVTYGYDEEVLLFANARVNENARGELSVRAVADFLVCKVDCIPGKVELERSWPIGDRAVPAALDAVALFDKFEEQVPISPNEAGLTVESRLSQSAVRPGDAFELDLVVRCMSDAAPCRLDAPNGDPNEAFFPGRLDGVDFEVRAVASKPAERRTTIRVAGKAGPTAIAASQTLNAVLVLENRAATGMPVRLAVSTELPRSETGAPVESTPLPRLADLGRTNDGKTATDSTASAALVDGPSLSLLEALLLALLGGLILNLMPCVLPVLAIKAFRLTELAHEESRSVALHALAYSIGIVLSLEALAGIVIALKGAGQELGWGFQFQEPLFIVAVAVVMTVFALNLFGVFELTVGATTLSERVDRSGGLARSAGEGVLAVVVATPCTAPFLGSALGFAFASSALTIVLVFAALGIGLALPFVMLSLIPGTKRLLPKPGAWMEVLKRALGFALLATVVWLAWVLGQVSGVDATIKLLVLLLAVATAVDFATIPKKRAARLALLAFAIVGLGALAVALRFDAKHAAASERSRDALPGDVQAGGAIAWRTYEPAAIAEELARGRVAFVDFTADWCITCKVNERLVLERSDVAAVFAKHDVAAFKADWTKRDERIRAELARHGKAGVPMYLVMSPSPGSTTNVLPEMLTPEIVIEAIERAASN